MLSRGIPWNMPLVTCRQKARFYTENTSDAWHIPRYPMRKHCITSMYYIVSYCILSDWLLLYRIVPHSNALYCFAVCIVLIFQLVFKSIIIDTNILLSQGFFVFICFGCNKQILSLFKNKFGRRNKVGQPGQNTVNSRDASTKETGF